MNDFLIFMSFIFILILGLSLMSVNVIGAVISLIGLFTSLILLDKVQ